MYESFVLGWAKYVTTARWRVIALTVLAALFLASGGRFLSFNSDYRVFFDGDDPRLLAFEELQATYTKNDNVLIALAPKSGEVFSHDALQAVLEATEEAWQTPYSIRVDSLSNYQHTAAEQDDLVVEDLYSDVASLSASELARIKKIALNEPLLKHRIISLDAGVTAINITVELPGDDPGHEIGDVVAHANAIKADIIAKHPDIDVYLSGIVMLNNAFVSAGKNDTMKLIPLAVLAILILVLIQLRRVGGTLATFIVIVFSVAAAMGTAGWVGIDLTSPLMSAPIIILTMVVADCVHVLSNWLQQLRTGLDKQAAMAESLRINFTPVMLTSVTTAIGFLSLNFSDAPPFRDLGNVSAMGVIYAWLLAITFLPALVTLLPVRLGKSKDRLKAPMSAFTDFVINKRKPLMWGITLAIVVFVGLIPRNDLNDEFVKYFDHRIPFRGDTEFVVEHLTGIYFIDYSVDSKESGAVSSPEFLSELNTLVDWFRAQPEVIHVNTITDTFKRLNQTMHADDPDWYQLPESRELAAQYLLLYEMSLPYGLDLNNQIDIDKQRTRLSITLESLTTRAMIDFEQRVADYMQESLPNLSTVGASPSLMFAHIGMANIKSMLLGTFIAILAISGLLMIAFKSWRYGLLSLIPNLAPAGLAFGLWALYSGEVGMGLSVVTAMTLGIVVDDTIHFMSKYLRALREHGQGVQEAIRYAFSTVGIALWVTSLALIAGFSVLSTSSFKMNADMGLLVSVIIALALVVDFLLLPALLIKWDSWLNKDLNINNVKR